MKGYYYIRFIIDNQPVKNSMTLVTDAGSITLTDKFADQLRKAYKPEMMHRVVKVELTETRAIITTL